MPLFKHQRSDYVHLDSVEPDLWTRIQGLFHNIIGTVAISGQPIIVSTDGESITSINIHQAAAFGLATGYAIVSKFGANTGIASGVTEDIYTVGGTKVWITTASAMEIVSSSGLDTLAGTGANKVSIQGLDANWDNQEVEVDLNGGTAAIAGTWRRINRAFVSQVGTYGGNNVGLLTIRTVAGSITQSDIRAGKGQTEQTHWSMARNKTGVLTAVYISTDSTKLINAELYQNSGISDIVTPFVGAKRKVMGLTGLQGGDQYHHVTHSLLTGPCDLWWQATSFANGTEVEAGFDILIKDD